MAAVLTVDDSPSIRQAIKIALGAEGHQVAEAGDGADGVAKAKAGAFNLIITDLNMPVMDGLTMIKTLRAEPAYAGVPILFLTTESDDGVKAQAKAAGATGWITKPFAPDQLVRIVSKVLAA
jgi:two-component system chemotaxis response regulator CheY